MLYQEKVPGGKLVCVEIWPAGEKVEKIKITGDFFLHPEDSITEIEKSLTGVSISLDNSQLESQKEKIKSIIEDALARNNAQLIGVTPEQLADLFFKAVAQGK